MVSSLDISCKLNVSHSKVLKVIREMIKNETLAGRVQKTSYRTPTNFREYPMFLISEDAEQKINKQLSRGMSV